MSLSDLRKLPTEWLDYNDQTAGDTYTEASNRQLSTGSIKQTDWEVIGISSENASLSLPRGRSQSDSLISSARGRSTNPVGTVAMTSQQRTRQEEGVMLKICGVSRRVFAPVSFTDLGTGRFAGTRLLLLIRLLFLFMHAVSAGFSYALREKVSVHLLLWELFLWLHLTFLFILPLLLLSTLLTVRWNLIREEEGESEESSKHGQRGWLAFEVFYQVVIVLAQTELARLLILHWVPQLRPNNNLEGFELLYSLDSPFAVQRYLMVSTTTIDMLMSTVPLRAENGIVTLLVFIPWAAVTLFSRPTAGATGLKIAYLFGSITFIVLLTFLNVLLCSVLSSFHRLRRDRHNEKQRTTMNIV